MNKNLLILILILILSCSITNAQLEMRLNPYIKGAILLKNDSIKNGYIQLESSAFRVRFRKNKDQKGKEKIDYRSIKKIIIETNTSKEREFYYKKTDADKFLKFVELVHSSKYDVYVNSSNNLSLFYKGVDRSNVNDFISFGEDYTNRATRSVSEIKDNLMRVEKPKYLLDDKNTNELQFIYSNKRLRKNAQKFFRNCPELLRKIENKEYKTSDIIEIIDIYSSCSEVEKE